MAYHLSQITKDDIPSIISLHYAVFNTLLNLAFKPDIPPMRDWAAHVFTKDLNSADTHLYKIVYRKDDVPIQEDSKDRTNAGDLIVAFGRWLRVSSHTDRQIEAQQEVTTLGSEQADGGEQKVRPDCGNAGWIKEVMGLAERSKRQVLGGREEYWYLSTLATHPDHQRRGLGSLLLQGFTRQIAESGCHIAYVESSTAGKKLYEKFGFEVKNRFNTEVDGVVYEECCMLRGRNDGAMVGR